MTAFLLIASAPAVLAAEDARPLSAAEFTARYRAFRALDRDPATPAAAVVPGGVRLLRAAGGVRGLPGGHRRAAARALSAALADRHGELGVRGRRWADNLAAMRAGRRPRPLPDGSTLAGPREIREALKLIHLIQTTIAPDTWDVNGGPSNITYFDLYQALVVKAPQRVHGEIGGALEGLRK